MKVMFWHNDSFLSKDRLTHVNVFQYFNNSKAYLATTKNFNTCLIGLGSNVGVYFFQGCPKLVRVLCATQTSKIVLQ
jgi:hypothetical protein